MQYFPSSINTYCLGHLRTLDKPFPPKITTSAGFEGPASTPSPHRKNLGNRSKRRNRWKKA
jgi:hypothetical protein